MTKGENQNQAEHLLMIFATLVLILSTGFFLFYLQIACQKILRREFEQEYYNLIVNANRLEFPSVRKAVEEFGGPLDYPRVRMMLKCDFLALSYLLEHANKNLKLPRSRGERLVLSYFRLTFLVLRVCHILKVGEKPAVLKLTEILQYLGNVVGESVSKNRMGNLMASGFFLNAR